MLVKVHKKLHSKLVKLTSFFLSPPPFGKNLTSPDNNTCRGQNYTTNSYLHKETVKATQVIKTEINEEINTPSPRHS